MPDRLRQVHPVVHAHDDLFPQDTDDEVWLRESARNGWIVLTRDDRIRYRPGEQRAIVEAGVACFCLNPTKGMTATEWAEALVTALPKILEMAAFEKRSGYIKGVNRQGRVRHLFPAKRSQRGGM